ncbi:30S ribosomal protein S1 [Edaphobacter acidisoli]|uniref:30S ribosomal protein S1 n=1 Tax=Edaphobacter acidisoli TaxID=2040573 RepID=A0A916RP34_9BACT|nr:30S ribosomal protein S1 [Edaphobacter acidisoli]GGA64562.1 30S ribosomal protein S1 [Edaphobacter acidisoli]
MSNPGIPETETRIETNEPAETSESAVSNETSESNESFDAILSEYEHSHQHRTGEAGGRMEGTVVAVTAEWVFVDIGFKAEGVLPAAVFASAGEMVAPGDKLLVTVKGRNDEGYLELSRMRVEQPKDWSALERAFAEKAVIAGTVTGVVKGGLSVDVGVRAFMPASRSGVRDAAEMEKLVGQEVRCRITKLDAADEDVVVDRRGVLEEEERSTKERRFSEVREGDIVSGTVRSLADYGAFVDIGGVDGLLHVSDIAWTRVKSPADVLSVGQQVEAKVLKVDGAARRISLGMKQLQQHPWDAAAGKYVAGERVRGTVTRAADFGAFVELEPGVEGMVHVSEMSWAKKVRKASDMLKVGDVVEVMILGVNQEERRMSLGLKQALGDPWADIAAKFPVGSAVEGTVASFTKFGAFVQVAEGVEGMIHVSEISAEKRVERPQDVLRAGQVVKAKVLDVDREKRQMRLSMKQLVPTGLDEYIAEHKLGDVVTGRLMEIADGHATVELGEGIIASGRVSVPAAPSEQSVSVGQVDLSSLSSMLAAKWKSGPAASEAKSEPVRVGQIRSFKITLLDRGAKRIEVRLV